MSRLADRVVTVRELLEQVWKDWNDKEVQAGYTYTYIWMANQLGHFALGALPVLFVSWLILALTSKTVDEIYCSRLIWFPLAVAIFWVIKEIRDVVRAKAGASGNPFRVNTGDLVKDAGTAVYFLWAGILVATLGLRWPAAGLISFFVLFAIGLIPSWYWLQRKLCFQRVHLPYLARLADVTSGFNLEPARLGPDGVERFLAAAEAGSAGNPLHLLIFGEIGTGRTFLSVAIGTEHSFKVRRARYVTWTRFLEMMISDPIPCQQDGAHVWPWMSADILILDDMLDQSPGPVDAQKSQELLQVPKFACDVLRKQRVVWVFGPLKQGVPTAEAWIGILRRALDMEPEQFGYVELREPHDHVRPRVSVASLSGH